MFSTPLICCSSGVTTVVATTSALAPGYWPVMLTTGGAISGYWAIGRRPKETTPRITNTSDTTPAKIGRSMKKREMRISRSAASVGPGRSFASGCRGVGIAGRLLRRHLDAGTHPHQAVDDDPIAGLEPCRNHAQARYDWTQRHVFRPCDILAINHQDEFANLLGADSGVRHEQCLVRRPNRHLDASEHTRGEDSIGIGEFGARANRS